MVCTSIVFRKIDCFDKRNLLDRYYCEKGNDVAVCSSETYISNRSNLFFLFEISKHGNK